MYEENDGFETMDLSQFDDDFKAAEVETGEYVQVPDGKYQVNVDRVELTKSRNGNPMLKWTFRILAPVHRGRLLWKNSVITDRTLKWLKKDLVICGLQLDRLSELSDRLHDLVNIQLEINKRTKGEDENLYLQQRIAIDGASSNENDFDEAMIPF